MICGEVKGVRSIGSLSPMGRLIVAITVAYFAVLALWFLLIAC
jgi:hypothetical protein